MESSPQTIIKPKSMRESPVSGPRARLPRLVGGAPCQKLRCAATARPFSIDFKANAARYRGAAVEEPTNSGLFARSSLPLRGPSRFSDAQRLDFQFALGLEQVVAQGDPSVLLANPQQGISRRHHAGCRARVPRPAPSPAVAPTVVDVSRLLSGNEPIDGEVFWISLF